MPLQGSRNNRQKPTKQSLNLPVDNARGNERQSRLRTYGHRPGCLQTLHEAHVGVQQLQGLFGGSRSADAGNLGLLSIESQPWCCLRQKGCQLCCILWLFSKPVKRLLQNLHCSECHWSMMAAQQRVLDPESLEGYGCRISCLWFPFFGLWPTMPVTNVIRLESVKWWQRLNYTVKRCSDS